MIPLKKERKGICSITVFYVSFGVYFVRRSFLLILRKKLIIAKFETVL